MNRRQRNRIRAGLRFLGVAVLAVLYGAAYGAFGWYVAMFIDAVDGGDWMWMWLIVWVAFGSVVLTVWTIRWTGVGANWFRQEPTRSTEHHRQNVTPAR